MIQFLEWDSSFFEKKIGRFECDLLTMIELDTLIKGKSTQNYDLVYLFTNNIEKEVDNYLKNRGIHVIDHKVTYAINGEFQACKGSDFIEPYQGSLTKDLLNLALLSGHESRFKKDPLLNPKFNLLYTQWIEKSLSGQLADRVFVAKNGKRISGFVTANNNNKEGQIGLIAVDPAYHGQGIGRLLIQAAHNWYSENKLTRATVVTQLTNKGACRLYETMGYHQETTKLILHIYRNKL